MAVVHESVTVGHLQWMMLHSYTLFMKWKRPIHCQMVGNGAILWICHKGAWRVHFIINNFSRLGEIGSMQQENRFSQSSFSGLNFCTCGRPMKINYKNFQLYMYGNFRKRTLIVTTMYTTYTVVQVLFTVKIFSRMSQTAKINRVKIFWGWLIIIHGQRSTAKTL